MSIAHYEDPAFVKRYAEGPSQFVPGYKVMQHMAAQLIAEHVGSNAHLLILGAGGGLELEVFAGLHDHWRFTGVDPSAEMLKAARQRVGAAGFDQRTSYVHGYIEDAPEGPFDAATCLLTLLFVADDGSKLETLKQTRRRLRRGAPVALVDLCIAGPEAEKLRDRYATFALDSGADAQRVAETKARLVEVLHTVSPERNVELLGQAGFSDVELFFAGLSWRGWMARA